MEEQHSGRMSITPARAYDDKRMSDRARTVLGLIGTYGNRDGWCWPSQTTMADRLGVSRQAVAKQIDELIDLGYIVKKPRTRLNGSTTSCAYKILFDPELDPADERVAEVEEAKPAALQLPKAAPLLTPKVNMYYLAKKIAEYCRMNFDLNRGMLLKEAKLLSGIEGFKEEDLVLGYGENGTWYTQDFRGKRGSPPSPKQIRETWQQYVIEQSSSNVHVQTGEGWANV